MGDQNTTLDSAAVHHLLRRTGFGSKQKDVDNLLKRYPTRGLAADKLLSYRPKRFTPRGKDFTSVHNKWLKFLLKDRNVLQSKLALFWHDHFSVANSKVQDPKLMGNYVQLLYLNSRGNLKSFVKAMNRDAAMMEFLDTVRNRKQIPNENYGRELQELFTMGVLDFAGNENYTQEDIVQISRAFTGWRYDDRGRAYFDANRHDFEAQFPGRGPKVIFKTTGGFGPAGRSFTVNGEGEPEIDTVIDIIFDHTDTDGKKTVARYVTRRLFTFLAYADPSTALIDELIATSGFDTDWEITPLVRALLVHDAFYETLAPAPFGAATKKSVKWPIDYFVGTLRMLGVKPKSTDQIVYGGSFQSALTHLGNMGQTILDPPSVFGWDWETGWVSSATLLARYTFARDVIAARGKGSAAFRPERKLIDLDLTAAGDIVDAVTDVLGITSQGTSSQITAAERTVLVDYLTDGGLNPTLDLRDYDVRNTKLHGLFALVMQSPAYQVH
jgi:uncharacterized protein (DUF1800 family)